jgi:hypothetical protein
LGVDIGGISIFGYSAIKSVVLYNRGSILGVQNGGPYLGSKSGSQIGSPYWGSLLGVDIGGTSIFGYSAIKSVVL